ncbi:response regulator transcription factor [Siphonobacter aquaeclarae]|jgi:two-component system cell cycle response regulator|uniref:Helix-turn-helix domain-containing protein n=1 Tax=Siphonobacter aquaeclarae TaxID=563176 RepID=A0A1G9WC57_9BACT|nr:response regulator [Siphonobacter aquaeclarae]SDM81853.1 Helix-turn-helix domain-containing protein [Siphonobacter aquaeclarae]
MAEIPNILLVDDNEEIIAYLTDILGEDYELFVATHGEEAIERLRNEAIHLVVSDIMMPVMDGLELCRRIKTDKAICHVPVILLTAKDTIESKIEGLETGADAYIEKPVFPDYLRAQISNLLSNRRQLRSYFAGNPLVHMETISYTKADQLFLEKVSGFILTNMDEVEMDLSAVAGEVNMSRMTLHRKIKALTDMTPGDFVNLVRLRKSAELLSEGSYKVYEVAFMTGFKSPAHFSKSFHRQFGFTPTQFVQNQ